MSDEDPDLLNDKDEDFLAFLNRKNTILGNITRLASCCCNDEHKREGYIEQVNKVF